MCFIDPMDGFLLGVLDSVKQFYFLVYLMALQRIGNNG